MSTKPGVLVVDDSAVYRALVSTLMGPYASSVRVVSRVAEAIEIIDSDPTLELVICDVVIGDESGFEVLEHVHGLQRPRPEVLMVTGYRDASGPQRTRELGGLGYLEKPTSIRQILQTLEGSSRGDRRGFGPRSRCAARAFLVEPDRESPPLLAWDVYNLGAGGALLETRGPLPAGAEFELLLELPTGKARVRARVVRVQEPSWLDPTGVGVEFIGFGPGAEEKIRAAIEGDGC